MKFGIVTFPGSNCDYDAYRAVVDELGAEATYLWHKTEDLEGVDVVVLPGGFSYGDYLRAGAIARFSPIMREVVAHAGRGGPVLAICNGFQIACEAGLLPGALVRNAGMRFVSEAVYLSVENEGTMFTSQYEKDAVLRIPIAHGEGRYVADATTLARLEDNGQVVFRYCDAGGSATGEANPNGSMRGIAGIVSAEGNVLGMMPHPERAVDSLLGPADGKLLFESLLARVAV
ncbi:MAG: phosphoribosylformylglycinamidine synthase subunit PurQ [Gemmatimonadaceae bacterium]|nr:phosphoribosylformylglycinamidine synthase subunit PurQ [Gemmatimonadaceae bacterium]